MTNPTEKTRVHVLLGERAVGDITELSRVIECSTSQVVSSAVRCFRACLAAGLAAESGELLHVRERPAQATLPLLPAERANGKSSTP